LKINTIKFILNSFLLIILIGFFISCKDSQQKEKYCYTDIFKYISQNNPDDTIKFYGFTKLDSAIECAKKQQKNILTIFSCWGCLSSKGLEWQTLTSYQDNEFIQNNYVIAWLPVDDKRLFEDTNSTEKFNNQQISSKTLGNKNYALQLNLLKTNTQPSFCFIDTNLKVVGKTLSYTKDKKVIEAFISSGQEK